MFLHFLFINNLIYKIKELVEIRGCILAENCLQKRNNNNSVSEHFSNELLLPGSHHQNQLKTDISV